jgi:hypothetical protein
LELTLKSVLPISNSFIIEFVHTASISPNTAFNDG